MKWMTIKIIFLNLRGLLPLLKDLWRFEPVDSGETNVRPVEERLEADESMEEVLGIHWGRNDSRGGSERKSAAKLYVALYGCEQKLWEGLL